MGISELSMSSGGGLRRHENNGHSVYQQAAAWPAPGAAQLILAGTETAVRSGGYMEGTVDTVVDSVQHLLNSVFPFQTPKMSL